MRGHPQPADASADRGADALSTVDGIGPIDAPGVDGPILDVARADTIPPTDSSSADAGTSAMTCAILPMPSGSIFV